MSRSISIIIPVLNEAENLPQLMEVIRQRNSGLINEIIVADGGSTDNTTKLAKELGAKVIISPKTGRAAQMNAGAGVAKGDILYFLHADTYPPENFDKLISDSITNNIGAGCFLLKFDCNHPGLKFYAYFTKYKTRFVRYGDQSLYIKASLFKEIGGFKESLVVMEDQEIYHRIRKYADIRIIQKPVVTSAQKYRVNGVVRLQLIFSVIFLGYYMGVHQNTLVHIYRSLIRTK